MNEELTAEEWKRRYEKEKEKVSKLRGAINKYELELQRWRGGRMSPFFTGVVERIVILLDDEDGKMKSCFFMFMIGAVFSASYAVARKA